MLNCFLCKCFTVKMSTKEFPSQYRFAIGKHELKYPSQNYLHHAQMCFSERMHHQSAYFHLKYCITLTFVTPQNIAESKAVKKSNCLLWATSCYLIVSKSTSVFFFTTCCFYFSASLFCLPCSVERGLQRHHSNHVSTEIHLSTLSLSNISVFLPCGKIKHLVLRCEIHPKVLSHFHNPC